MDTSQNVEIDLGTPALTTKDNPYNPFDNFIDWWRYDMEKGYNSCEHLMRVAHTSDALSDDENNQELNRAIDQIIRFDFMGIYQKVFATPMPVAV